MKKNLRKWLILSALAFSFGGAALGVNALETTAETFTPGVQMLSGAAVRIVKDGDAVSTAGNGLRFTSFMTKADYDILMDENSGYTDVQFGILIAPNTSAYKLTAASVFGTGEDKKYDWATWNTETQSWDYTAGSYTRIMNFTSEKMYEATYACEVDGNVYFRGSEIDLKETNIPVEFQGIGYLKYTFNGATEYVMTTAETRSMTYVAQLAIEAGDENSTWLQEKYVTPYAQTATNYTVEHYLEQADGTFKLDETLTETQATTVGTDVTTNAKDLAYYAFDESNANNVVSGKAYANDKLVLKRYYKLAAADAVDLGLKDVTVSGATVSLAEIPAGLTRTLYKVIGETKTEVTADLTGETLALTGLNGVYVVEATKADGTVIASVQFDAYDPEKFEWFDFSQLPTTATTVELLKNYYQVNYGVYMQNDSSNVVNFGENSISLSVVDGETEGLPAGATGNFVKWTHSNSANGYLMLGLVPMHTQAYYQLHSLDSMTIDMISSSDLLNANGGKGYFTESITANTRYTKTITVSALLEDWENAKVGKHILYDSRWRTISNTTIYFGNIQYVEKQMIWADPNSMAWGSSPNNDTTNGVCRTSQYNKTTYYYASDAEKTAVNATGNFYKITVGSGFYEWNQKFKILPTQTLEYYQEFVNKTLAFDWWFTIGEETNGKFTVYGGTETVYEAGKVHTVTISMQTILDDWTNLSTKGNGTDFVGEGWLKTGNGMTNSNGASLILYIGNIRAI